MCKVVFIGVLALMLSHYTMLLQDYIHQPHSLVERLDSTLAALFAVSSLRPRSTNAETENCRLMPGDAFSGGPGWD